MSIHEEPHPQADQTVRVIFKGTNDTVDFVLEDWWDRVNGSSWRNSGFNYAASNYAIRNDVNRLPSDDEVVYGKIGPFGHIIHESEIVR